ncbi:DUF2809 domain-containing protein [Shewanella pneumatophori]|uniref:DUF2809 domain-containing protein n=1 Tax=Shewanella pneumatophori TaxID=314092 RepID=A0A9X1ZCP9_9GAMM|nr:DUF2809 domain-containing protein [Shewanella pneumatophori]MCL1137362.1 DUF2809 domain-containing protein [Shewanella pneumatophori]
MKVNKVQLAKSNAKQLSKGGAYFRFCLEKAVISFSLLLVLIFIAAFVRDTFIRPIVGDVLVVVWLYYLLASFLKLSIRALVVMTLSIAFSVEFAQYFNVPSLLGIEPATVIGTILGATFDWLDLIAYITGGVLCVAIESLLNRRVAAQTGQ